MFERLYVHNFRCLQNFEFKPAGVSSALLLGRNGAGKSTVARLLRVLQTIGRGTNRVGKLVQKEDIAWGGQGLPMQLEVDVLLPPNRFTYRLVLELPERFHELRVQEETLEVDGQAVFSRHLAEVGFQREDSGKLVTFPIDWHLVALPVIQDPALSAPLNRFRQWLAQMVILSPLPQLMTGASVGETLEPRDDGSDFPEWMAGLLAQYPAAYSSILEGLRQVMPDLFQFRNLSVGRDAKSLLIDFRAGAQGIEIPFDNLSDGEKCFFLSAVLAASNQAYGPLFAFWDEPDNHLSMSEAGHSVMALRRAFSSGGGQIWVTSHHAESIRSFSNENTWWLSRADHLSPTVARSLDELKVEGDLVQAILANEVAQ